jgi:hypothetical protein
MRALKRFFQYKVYRKIILSYIVIVTITISLVCTILYFSFSSSAANAISHTSESMLIQTSYTSDVIYNQVFNISSQLLADNDIISFFYLGKKDILINYRAMLYATKIQNIYPYIRSISLYNISIGNYINTLGFPADAKVMDSKSFNKYMDFYPRVIKTGLAGNEKTTNVLTFSFSLIFHPLSNPVKPYPLTST